MYYRENILQYVTRQKTRSLKQTLFLAGLECMPGQSPTCTLCLFKQETLLCSTSHTLCNYIYEQTLNYQLRCAGATTDKTSQGTKHKFHKHS